MADRYWVGGAGTWNTTSTTNWSASSGGASGASVPTSADNVFFDQAGTYTVTIGGDTNCKDLTISAGTVTITNTVTAYNFSTYGNVTLLAGSTFSPYGPIFFYNTTAGTTLTITTNGVTVGGNIVSGCYFRPSNGATVVLGSAFTTTKYFYFGPASGAGGTFDTAGYALTCPDINPTGTSPTITLNNSTVTITTYGLASSSTNFTLNAGTSTLNLNGGIVDPRLCGVSGTYTYYNINLTDTSNNYLLRCYSNLVCNNFTVTGKTGFGVRKLVLYGSFTVNGTFSFGTPTNYACRSGFISSTTGTARTLSIATVGTLTAVDFSDITFSGATLTGTSLGDCGGNSNITFDAAKTVYYRQTGSASWGATGTGSWSATSGGAADATMFPLAQDTAVFPAATYPASGSTTTINGNYNIGTIDMSLRTSNTMTLATGSNLPTIYGNWTNGTGTTLSGTSAITFSGRTTQQITSAGKSFTQPITFSSPSSTVQLQDAFTTATTVTTTLTQGTLNLQSYTLSTGLFNSSNSNTRTIAFGTGNITCTGTGTVWQTSNTTGLTTTGTQVVNVTSTGSTTITVANGALSEANSISYNFTGGTYALTFLNLSGYSARNVDFTGYAGTTGSISATVIYGNLKFSTGMTVGASGSVLTFGATSGTQQITTNGKTIDFPIAFNGVGGTFQLQGALTMGSTRTATLTNGTLDLNGKTMTVGTAFTTAIGTKNLTFNGGILVCPTASTTAFNNAAPTNFTTTAGTGTGTISMTAATAKTFVGGGSTFNCTVNQGGAGTLTITGSNTFADITNTVQPATVLFTAGTTTTFTSGFSLSGTAGNLITIGSVTAASHTLSKASGAVSVSYCSISRSTATGGATWSASTSNGNVDGGNNSGWNFASGTIYNVSLSETGTSTDLFSAVPVYASVVINTSSATDVFGVAPSIFGATVANTATATDTTATLVTFGAATSDTSIATDATTARFTAAATVANTATATDTITNAGSTYNAPVTNTATATDAITNAGSIYSAPVTNIATVTDSPSTSQTFITAVFNTATATDTGTTQFTANASVANTATATDNFLVAPSTFNAPVVNVAAASDAITNAGSIYNVPFVDTATATDLFGGAFLWNLIDDSQTVTWTGINTDTSTTWDLVDDSAPTTWQNIDTLN